MHRPRARRSAAAVLVAAAVLAGCGSAEKEEQQVVAQPTNGVAPAQASPTATPQATATPRRRSTAILSPADRRSFAALAARLPGAEGVAVSGIGPGRRVQRLGSLRTGVAWSTSKLAVALAVVARDGGTAAQQANLTRAITASDNAAALALWASLGGGATAAAAAQEQVRAAGDARTRIESQPLRGSAYTPFGQTAWSLTDQTRFMAGLPCTPAGPAVLDLMGRIVASQHWGLGATGSSARFKGGWGPGTTPGRADGWLERQIGVVTVEGRPLVVAIASRPADGSHGSGTRDLTVLARWVASHADVSRLPRQPDCGG